MQIRSGQSSLLFGAVPALAALVWPASSQSMQVNHEVQVPVTAMHSGHAFQDAPVTSASLVCAGKGKGKASKKGAATDKLLPPLIFSIESWEAQLITLSTASESCTALISWPSPHWLLSRSGLLPVPEIVVTDMAATLPYPDPAWQVSRDLYIKCPCSAGKVNLMAHAKRSTNRDFKLNKRPAQPRSAPVAGAMGVDARAPPEVCSLQPEIGLLHAQLPWW